MSRFAARLGAGLFALLVAASPAPAAEEVWSHGLSLFGDLKYGPGFTHFDYADPAAPKGGEVRFAAEGTFDSLNPYLLTGVSAAGLEQTFETLLERAQDEPDAAYGLIAESVSLAPDRRSVRFRLRPEARWHDGTPITAADVVFSLKTFKTAAHPVYQLLFADVGDAIAEGERTVRIVLNDPANRKLPLIVATELPILPAAFFATRRFEATTLEPIMGSGPYRVADFKAGRFIAYERVPDYWGADLPVRAGRHNFALVRYEYFRDRTVMVEAFKAGEYDFHEEFTAKTWATAYDTADIAKGRMIKEVLPDRTPSGVQAFFINTRREKFQDRRVRQALDYAFDFEWTNANLFHGAYERMRSYFENSELAARGTPSEAERALLEPLRGRIPEEAFAAAYTPPRTDGEGGLRANLRTADALLRAAGWTIAEGRRVEAATGEALTIEILYFLQGFERVFAPYARNLERLGIEATLRLVDPAQYEQRVKEFDFDLTTQRYVQFLSPGAELRSYFGSGEANREGSRNLAGIADSAVDALIETVLAAESREALTTAARALDRVLLAGHYVVPQWFKGEHHLVYWNMFSRPPVRPLYALGLDGWWVDPAKEAALNEARNGLK